MTYWIRAAGAAAGLALAGAAGGAAAQSSGDFSGTYTFMTYDYLAGTEVGILSGIVRSAPMGGGYYSITLYAMDYQQRASGEVRYTAYQECEGRRNGPDITVTCRVVDSTGGNYQPDNFTLRQVNAWQWDGTFTSTNSATVTFVHFPD